MVGSKVYFKTGYRYAFGDGKSKPTEIEFKTKTWKVD